MPGWISVRMDQCQDGSARGLHAGVEWAEDFGWPARRDSRCDPDADQEYNQTDQPTDRVPGHFNERRGQPE